MPSRTCPSTHKLADVVDEILGRPFELGARGPGAFDCLGLLLFLYSRFGVKLPDPFAVDRLSQLSELWDAFERVRAPDVLRPLDVIFVDFSAGPDPLRVRARSESECPALSGKHVSIVESPRTEIVTAHKGTVSRRPIAEPNEVFRYSGWSRFD